MVNTKAAGAHPQTPLAAYNMPSNPHIWVAWKKL